MNIDDLWIGDRLHVKSINEAGTFEGTTAKGLLIVQLNIGTVEVMQHDVELLPDEEAPPFVPFQPKPAPIKKSFTNQIDLHFDVLSAGKSTANHHNILSQQIAACRSFIKEAIAKKEPYVNIIHGKGEGLLKKAINELLEEFKTHIFVTQPANKGGAILVYFKL